MHVRANHLGNVLVVFTDKRIPLCSSGTVYKYQADLKQAMHYSAFGAPMPDLRWYASSSTQYRFGQNMQEQDDEIAGDGNIYSAEFWEYDARVARRWNIDPVFKNYESPYACFGNSPLMIIDVNGAVGNSHGIDMTDIIQFDGMGQMTAFNVLFHELIEGYTDATREAASPAAARQFDPNDPYQYSHWVALIAQAKERKFTFLYTDMVRADAPKSAYDDGFMMIYTYEPIKDKTTGAITGYTRTTYKTPVKNSQADSSKTEVTKDNIDVATYNKEKKAAEDKIKRRTSTD